MRAAVAATLDRAGLWRAQTPQGFRFADILAAHERGRRRPHDLTDDAAVAEWAGLPVALVPGSDANIKLTTAEDLAMAERAAARRPTCARAGLRRASPRRRRPRLAVRRQDPPHPRAGGPLRRRRRPARAHRRAARRHRRRRHRPALPRHRPALEGRRVAHLPADAAARVRARGGAHLQRRRDAPVRGAQDRPAPRRHARGASPSILGIERTRVGVKATTTEGLGFTGRREGIAAMATAP